MAFGSGETSEIRSDINITPLVDVVLVLLIIFMVATPILQTGLDVEVPPKVEVTSVQHTAPDQLVVSVKVDGTYLNGRKTDSRQSLREALVSELASRAPADKVVFVNAEDKVTFDQAVIAMDVAHEAGAAKVGFLTDPP